MGRACSKKRVFPIAAFLLSQFIFIIPMCAILWSMEKQLVADVKTFVDVSVGQSLIAQN